MGGEPAARVESGMLLVPAEALEGFAARCFMKLGVPKPDAQIASNVLIEADLRGIDSHGIARLNQWFYLGGLREGRINPRPRIRVVHEAPATALVDGDGGLGLVVGYRAMELAMGKAKATGAGFVAVRNSRHFGIAGYYAGMALVHDMIGISMTNTAPLVLPTFGRDPMLGTNPISLAAPTDRGTPFLLDMATSTVAAGKLELAQRQGQPIPLGWATDAEAHPTTDPALARQARRLLPLGSTPELSSHKGYGLAAMVDILCGVLSGAGPGPRLERGSSGHFFGALRIEGFRPAEEFKRMQGDMHEALRRTPVAAGYQRVLVPGDPEFETRAERTARGIPLDAATRASLESAARELNLPLPW